jgi:hypothetical protein
MVANKSPTPWSPQETETHTTTNQKEQQRTRQQTKRKEHQYCTTTSHCRTRAETSQAARQEELDNAQRGARKNKRLKLTMVTAWYRIDAVAIVLRLGAK